jgi:hypothetical protein
MSVLKRVLFIGGCPRSGTTLLAACLGAGQRCITTPESPFKTRLLGQRFDDAESRLALRTLLAGHPRARQWGVDPGGLPLQGTGADIMTALVDAYAAKHDRAEWETWVDHTPSNILNVGPLLQDYPGAHFIHIVRDGRATAASVIPLDWGPTDYLRAGRWWTEYTLTGIAAEKEFPVAVMRIHYEELLRESERVLRAICDFAGIAFEPAMCSGRGFDVPKYSRTQHKLVGTAMDASRADAWRAQITPRDLELFEWQAAPLLRELGYEPLCVNVKPPRWTERFYLSVAKRFRKPLDRLRKRRRSESR